MFFMECSYIISLLFLYKWLGLMIFSEDVGIVEFGGLGTDVVRCFVVFWFLGLYLYGFVLERVGERVLGWVFIIVNDSFLGYFDV